VKLKEFLYAFICLGAIYVSLTGLQINAAIFGQGAI